MIIHNVNQQFSPQAKELPPQAPDDDPYGDIEEAADGARFPPMPDVDVARSEQNRSGSRAVMGEASEEVAEAAEDQGRQLGRSPDRDRDDQERRIHRADVSDRAREKIVAVEIDQGHGQKPPAPMEPGDMGDDGLA